MELSFIASALRRRWWLVLAIVVAGALVALTIDDEADPEYRAEATVLVVPDPALSDRFSGRPDRFIANELARLRTHDLADDVAARLPTGVTPQRVRSATSFEQLPDTDVITIVATTDDPDRSVAIANAYAEVYLERKTSAAGSSTQALLEETQAELAALQAQLADVAARARAAAEPYVQRQLLDPRVPIPNLSVLAPELESERNLLQSQYSQLQSYRLSLERTLQESSASALVEPASDAEPVDTSTPVPLQGAVVLAALLLGLAAAPLSLALSNQVGDAGTVDEVIGHRVVGHVPFSLARFGSPAKGLTRRQRSSDEVEDSLWAMVEWGRGSAPRAVVAVTGVRRRSGTTTLALALAARAAQHGQRVVVVDADTRDPWLSNAFSGDIVDRPHQDGSHEVTLRSTPVRNVSVLPAALVLSRGTPIREVLRALDDLDVDVVIVDAGVLLSSSVALPSCELAQSIVLAIPLGRVTEKQLRDAAAVLSEVTKGHILPVTTKPRGPRSAPNRQSENVVTRPAGAA